VSPQEAHQEAVGLADVWLEVDFGAVNVVASTTRKVRRIRSTRRIQGLGYRSDSFEVRSRVLLGDALIY